MAAFYLQRIDVEMESIASVEGVGSPKAVDPMTTATHSRVEATHERPDEA